jgi:hypothetical protein
MNHRLIGINRVRLGLALLLALSLTSLGSGRGLQSAELGPDYSISWHTTQVGGGVSMGGEFSVAGTVGQADTAQVQGGEFSVSGGYWNEQSETSTPLTRTIFLPILFR